MKTFKQHSEEEEAPEEVETPSGKEETKEEEN